MADRYPVPDPSTPGYLDGFFAMPPENPNASNAENNLRHSIPAIREKIAERDHDNLPPKGLGDEAIRTVISALFESNKAKAEDAP